MEIDEMREQQRDLTIDFKAYFSKCVSQEKKKEITFRQELKLESDSVIKP